MNKKNQQPERRNFLVQAASMLGVAVCSTALSSMLASCDYDITRPTDIANQPGIDIDLNVETSLQTVGGSIRKTYGSFNGGRNIVIIRTSETEFLVVTAVCTHQGCDINLPQSPGANLVCPCHGAQFSSATGDVLQGPASTPLRKYPWRLDSARNVLVLNPGVGSTNPEQPTAEIKIDISKEPLLQSPGGAGKLNVAPYNDSRDIIIVRRANNTFLVATAVCAHQGCDVGLPKSPGANLVCPCHGAQYSSTDGTWQPSPQTASDLRTFDSSFDTGTNILTILM